MTNHAKTVRVTAIAVSLAYSGVLYGTGVVTSEDARRLLAYLPSTAVLLAIAWDLWVWKWPLMQRLSNRPLIRGTWETTIVPHAKSDIPVGGNRGPITAATVIEQSFWSLSVILLTEESQSHSTVAAITPTNGESKDRKELYYTYSNEPKMEHRPRSFVHRGTSHATVIGLRPADMEGTYWTDRLTMGSLQLRLLSRRTDWTSLKATLETKRMGRPGQG